MTLWILRRLASDMFARRATTNWRLLLPAVFMCCVRVVSQLATLKRLLALKNYRNYVCAAKTDDTFHFLSHRAYLMDGLSSSQRVEYVTAHYEHEQATFRGTYAPNVYLGKGICLWRYQADSTCVSLQLEMAPRRAAEGELSVTLYVDGVRLHSMSFNWAPGILIGVSHTRIPFIPCNQGRGKGSDAAFAAFNAAFPNNSPSFFCFSAMQGLALGAGFDAIAGLKSEFNPYFLRKPVNTFQNSYDNFWTSLGGVDTSGKAYVVALPFYSKPITDIKAKYRKRAASRRIWWEHISASSRASIQQYLLAPADFSSISAHYPNPSATTPWIPEGPVLHAARKRTERVDSLSF